MYRHKVEICGVDTSKLPVLKNDEMRDLFMRHQEDKELYRRKEHINGNLMLVLSVMKKFRIRGEYLDDLFQVLCIGIIQSIDNFDLRHNVRFSTYAVLIIVGETRRYLRDNNP